MAKSREAHDQSDVIESNPEIDESCLDPLMAVLAKYRSLEDLMESTSLIFARLDVDCSGGVGYDEMRDGLPRLLTTPRYFSVEDWCEITEDLVPAGTKTDDMELDLDQFQRMLLTQLKTYLLRQANKALIGGDQPYESIILVLKWLMVTFEESAGKSTLEGDLISRLTALTNEQSPASTARPAPGPAATAAVAAAGTPGSELGSNPPEGAAAADGQESPSKGSAEAAAKKSVSPFASKAWALKSKQDGSKQLAAVIADAMVRSSAKDLKGEPTAANAAAPCEGNGCANGACANAQLTQRIDRLEQTMLSNMASVHQQLALLIELQAPSMRPPQHAAAVPGAGVSSPAPLSSPLHSHATPPQPVLAEYFPETAPATAAARTGAGAGQERGAPWAHGLTSPTHAPVSLHHASVPSSSQRLASRLMSVWHFSLSFSRALSRCLSVCISQL